MVEVGIDLSDVKTRLLEENYLLALYFPTKGIVPLRILQRDVSNYLYNEVGIIASDEYKTYARLPISAENIDNLLVSKHKDVVLQLFYGIRPAVIRSYLGYPLEQSRRNLEVRVVPTKSRFGYVDGFQSPLGKPSIESETWIPYNIEVGFAWYNPSPESEYIHTLLNINRYKVSVLRNPGIISKVLDGTQRCRIATLGGLEPVDFNFREVYDVDPIPLEATAREIQSAVKTGGGT